MFTINHPIAVNITNKTQIRSLSGALYCIFHGTNVPMTICILISYMYVLPASKKCRASWPIKFIKGARPGLKRPAQVTMQQMQKKDLNMKRRKETF
jgi:hypothetical protein